MNFRRLSYFIKIAELGSISRAADRLRIAQPALSRQMNLLEEEMGVPLFARHRRGMVLTPEGEHLRAAIVGPLRQLDMAVEDVRSLSSELGGNVAFGMPPTVSYIFAGPLARRVAAQVPSVSLRIVEGYAGHLIDWLQRGELDIAILYGPAADYRLSAEELMVEELMLVGPPNCALEPSTPVRAEDLQALPLILPSHPHGLRVIVDALAAKAKIKLDIRFQADSFALMKDLVETGLGYAPLPFSSFSREAQAGRLRYAPISEPRITRQLMLAMQPGHSRPRAVHKLEDIVRKEIVALHDSGTWVTDLLFDPQDYRGTRP